MMRNLLIVGRPFFLARHRQLAAALRRHIEDVAELPIYDKLVFKIAFLMRRGMMGQVHQPLSECVKKHVQSFTKQPSTFAVFLA
jgi:hypothetical protein